MVDGGGLRYASFNRSVDMLFHWGRHGLRAFFAAIEMPKYVDVTVRTVGPFTKRSTDTRESWALRLFMKRHLL